jgi:hypothetical protein
LVESGPENFVKLVEIFPPAVQTELHDPKVRLLDQHCILNDTDQAMMMNSTKLSSLDDLLLESREYLPP